MSWTKEDLEAIDAAILNRVTSGAQEVEFPSGKRIKFDSLESLMKMRGYIIGEINKGLLGNKSTYSLATFP